MKLLRCHIILIIIFGSLLHLLSGCGITDESRKSMDRAEALMESAPDSAMTILDSITLGALSSERDKARHALLRSMALDKTFVDTITFDVLQPAIDCYLEKGTPDERLRTLYYQGRIYQNRKEDEEAMKCFIKATEFNAGITDSLMLAHAYTAKGSIYYDQNKYISAIRSYLKGADIYRDISRVDYQTDNLLQVLDSYINIQDRYHSDSILDIVKTLPREYYEAQNLYLHCRIVYANKFLSPMEIRDMLDTIHRDRLNDDLLLDLARGYVRAGDKVNSMECLKEVSLSFRDRVKYSAIKSEVEEINGEYREALTSLKKGIEASDSIVGEWTGDDRLFAESKYELERQIDAGNERELRIIFISIIIILSLCTISLGLLLCLAKAKIKAMGNDKTIRNQKYEAVLVNRKFANIQKQQEQINREHEALLKERHRLKEENSLYKSEAERLRKDTERQEMRIEECDLELSRITTMLDQTSTERDAIHDRCADLMRSNKELLERVAEMQATAQTLDDERRMLSQRLKDTVREAETMRRHLIDESTLINALIAGHITSNDSYLGMYRRLQDMIDNDREGFLKAMRERFRSIYPGFMRHLDDLSLSDTEQNYVCLYALGLRPKEIGDYLGSKRYYIVSSKIRMKLGLDKNGTNLGAFIKGEIGREWDQ